MALTARPIEERQPSIGEAGPCPPACALCIHLTSERRAFRFALLCACGRGGVLDSLGDFRAPVLSVSVARDGVGLEDGFELFMQLLGTSFHSLNCSC